ncbi:MAG: hypothetical protein M3Z84_09380 [Actinomycetota bacterium]|nr:hypothetical protein [Actinomycetota bacterium]
MRTAVAILVALGGALPIGAVLWGAFVARARHKDLMRRRQLALENGASIQTMIDAGLRPTTYADLAWMRVDDEIQRLKTARDSYGLPAAVGLLGVLCGTVGGVLALYLPT